MNFLIFLLCLSLICSTQQASISPTWIRDNKIDAGQVKAVNFGNGTSVNAGTSHTFLQPFVNGSFTSVPRFIYAMNSYGLDTSTIYNTTSIGYSIQLTNLLTTYYRITVTVIGIKMIALNYQYIAIQSYDHLYHISMDDSIYTRTFDSTSPLGNIALGNTRTEVLQFLNPDAYTLNQNYSNSTDLILRVWPVSFTHSPLGNVFSLKLSAAIINRTSFSVSITVDNQFVLQKLRISVLYVNKSLVYENSYTQVIVHANIIHYGGNSTLSNTTSTTFGTTPFIFRNAVYGYTGLFMPLLSTSANMFYFNAIVTNPQSIGYWELVQQGIRSCLNGSFTIFRTEDGLCHDSCPSTGYYINVTFSFCNKCHASCVNCTSNTPTSCTACNSANFRTLVNNSCPCMANYVDINNICTRCHYTCLSCINQLQTGCSDCSSGLNRELTNNSTCSCVEGYYSNITCLICVNSCVSCNYHTSNQTYQCLTCLVNSSRIVINSSCVCDSGYYQANNTCISCSIGCLSCTDNTATSCTSCNSSNFRILTNNNSCICMTSYININDVCTPCHYTCQNCINVLQSGCSSCSSSLNRQLINNSTCSCIYGYYQNTTCMICINNCTSCNYHQSNSSYQCLSCDVNSSKIISDGSCVCNIGSFQSNNTCVSCSIGCLNCSSLSTCFQCNTSELFVLTGTLCYCNTGYILNGSICQVSTVTICGNGIVQSGQPCDDGNVLNFDGCSSTCTIETDHTCINNIALSISSVCYYSRIIVFRVLSVYKRPIQNAVQIILLVSAQNCNQTYLKGYLQSNPSIELRDTSRRLSNLNSSDIITAQNSYSTQTNLLTINFQYGNTIDLSKKQILFSPSSSIVQNTTKYFFSSPSISTNLIFPTNKLQTIYFSQSQLDTFAMMNKFYLALIVLLWAFMFLALYLNQTAIVVQSFLIVQIVYETFIKCQFIYEGWAGLILYGKYTYGYNIPYNNYRTFDKLQVINLNSNMFSTLNLTFSILGTCVLFLCIIVIYQTIKFKLEQKYGQNKSQQLTKSDENNQFKQKCYEAKRIITILLFQICLALSFLTVKITTMSFFYLESNSSTTLGISITLYTLYAIIWFLYFKFYKMQLFMEVSFKKILRKSKQKIEMPFTEHLVQFYVKYYYFIIFIMLIIFGIVNSVQINGMAFFITIIMISIFFVAIGLVSNIYYRKQNSIRATVSILFFSILIILQILQSKSIKSFANSNIEPIIGLTLLFTHLTFNTGVMLRISYKKYRKNRKIISKNVQKKNKIKISQQIRNETQQPNIQKIVIFQDLRYQKPIQNDEMNMSQEHLAKSGKYSIQQERSQISMPQTNKKMAVKFQQNYDKTKQKFQHIDIDHLKYQSQQKPQQKESYNKTIDRYQYRQQYKLEGRRKVQIKKQQFEQVQVVHPSDSHSNRAIKNQENNKIQHIQRSIMVKAPENDEFEELSIFKEETRMQKA